MPRSQPNLIAMGDQRTAGRRTERHVGPNTDMPFFILRGYFIRRPSDSRAYRAVASVSRRFRFRGF